MKRTSSLISDESLASHRLKRANSSLFSMFSIDTIIEPGSNRPSVGSCLDLLPLGEQRDSNDADGISPAGAVTISTALVMGQRGRTVSVSESGSPLLSPSVAPPEEEDGEGGFFIDDDDSTGSPKEATMTTAEKANEMMLPTKIQETFLQNPTVDVAVTSAVATSPSVKLGDYRTGLVFESSKDHFDVNNRFHKERPLRVESVRSYLEKSSEGLWRRCCILGEKRNTTEESSPERDWLDDEDYLRVHLPGYMQRLDRLSNCQCQTRLNNESTQYKSLYLTPASVTSAKNAASSLIKLVSNVVSGTLDNGFAVIRPPGHHAEPSLPGGYCVLNNIALAASYARSKLDVNRVLIVDWDVHHGNGTQSIFVDDSSVLYFSVHRYHNGNFFPFIKSKNGGGSPNVVGNGRGKGFNMNVGWNQKGMGNDEYLAVWEKLLLPVANEFDPGLVLVSAGFDAASGDMGECNVTPECFGLLTRSLMGLANGRLVCALEGGYVRSVLGKCVGEVVGALLDRDGAEVAKRFWEEERAGREEEDLLDCIKSGAAKNIRDTIDAHRCYWNCLSEEEDRLYGRSDVEDQEEKKVE